MAKVTWGSNEWEPKIGEEIECKSQAEPNEPYGAWGCSIHSKVSHHHVGKVGFVMIFYSFSRLK